MSSIARRSLARARAKFPADLQAAVEERRAQLVEIAAESDDKLIEKYFETGELSDEEIRVGLEHGVAGGTLVPVLCGSASQNIGVDYLSQIFRRLRSRARGNARAGGEKSRDQQRRKTGRHGHWSPRRVRLENAGGPLCRQTHVFPCLFSGTMQSDSRVNNSRTNAEERIGQLYVLRGKEQLPIKHIYAGDIGAVAKLNDTSTNDTLGDKAHPLELEKISYPSPVYSVALSPKTKIDLDKMGPALQKLTDEDPTLRVYREHDTGESIMAGMGDSHVDVAVRRLKQKFGVELLTGVPKIPYKETITKKTEVQGRHKKQTGGRGQFGDTWVRFEPLAARYRL